MHIKEALKRVEDSKEYKDFIKKNPKFYLVHCFRLDEGKSPFGWQLGYYSEKEDKMVVFDVPASGEIKRGEKEDVFKQTKSIEGIELDHLEVFLDKALEIVAEHKKERASSEPIAKRLILLQRVDGKQMWNITLVTHSFKLLNVKIDTTSGEVLSESYESIMSIAK
ncbi:MAG: hypothetical protein V1659_00560 [Candidatus Woesearchaeota archaeon]